MLRPATSLLAALVSTTVVITTALGWGGWRLLNQQRAIDEQRARDQIESAADAVAAGIRGQLAEAGERLSSWLSSPSSALPAIDGAVVIGTRSDRIDVNPSGGLPFVPIALNAASSTDTYAALEAIEFGAARPELVRTGYRRLANSPEPHVRAGALLRLGRVQRKLRDFSGALATYQTLSALGAVPTDGLPAELAGLDGQRATYLAMANVGAADETAQRMRRGLDTGRWQLARGTAEFYREPFGEPRPASWRLANALSELWRDTEGRLPARGQRIFAGDDAASSVFVLWRSNGISNAVLVATADHFFTVLDTTPIVWQLTDPEGRVISGPTTVGAPSVARLIGNSDYPWTLHAWVATPSAAGTPGSRPVLMAMIGAMLTLVWGASFFMARAIRREAAVAQLQSDFVAAVSHEFRSPLTTVRQMAEMLDQDRVPTEERRHHYYKIVAGEAARLQRLVETLLNFGKMEAGAGRYRFVDLDAAQVVREVVDDIEPQARAAGKAIELDGPDSAIRVLADQSALSVALRNLIDNALKYSPDHHTVWVQWRRDHDRTAICVVDRGVGIPRSEQRSIFGKFVRGRAALDANIKGTGVGLSMVQHIVDAHGGEIRLESEPGRGSTFTLLLPAAP